MAIPTADLADGLAHSTLVAAPVSGDHDATRAALDELGVSADSDDEARRRLASWLAVEASASSARAAEAVERVLHPYTTPDGRFATVGGFGDVLDAVARERPGTGVALAIRDAESTRTAVLDAWRTHGRAVHAALSDATTGRYDGLLVARVEGVVPAVWGRSPASVATSDRRNPSCWSSLARRRRRRARRRSVSAERWPRRSRRSTWTDGARVAPGGRRRSSTTQWTYRG
ncbi:hypothetical protein [Haloplanus litoreus]|uniref:hypothetical protein n=1 Tax=Haloplanus litoreus TaxID=767515 RepID=UPI003A909388